MGDFDPTVGPGERQAKLVTNLNAESTYFAVLYKDDNGNWGHLQSAAVPYPRPGGATPLTVPLVPEFQQCTSPDSQHVAPLNQPSCSSPSLASSQLTMDKVGRGRGSARLDVLPGNPSTPGDEADLKSRPQQATSASAVTAPTTPARWC